MRHGRNNRTADRPARGGGSNPRDKGLWCRSCRNGTRRGTRRPGPIRQAGGRRWLLHPGVLEWRENSSGIPAGRNEHRRYHCARCVDRAPAGGAAGPPQSRLRRRRARHRRARGSAGRGGMDLLCRLWRRPSGTRNRAGRCDASDPAARLEKPAGHAAQHGGIGAPDTAVRRRHRPCPQPCPGLECLRGRSCHRASLRDDLSQCLWRAHRAEAAI